SALEITRRVIVTDSPELLFFETSRVDATYFTRIERVTNVTRTDRGILAEVDGELLRVDVIRDDIVRLKISRGGSFDEQPTYAVCADLSGDAPAFTVEEDDQAVRVRTAQIVLTIARSPFRIDAHRADGSLIFETLRDRDGNSWAYATLNDEFVIRRRCRQEDAFFGLGEKTGHLNRKGRDFTLWNTDVLDPITTVEFTAGWPKDDPRSNRMSTAFDPYYITIPFFYHMAYEENVTAGFFVDNGYRARVDLSTPRSYSLHFQGGQYTEYVFAGPSMRDILAGYTWLTGRMLPPPLWALGYHQCRWHHYTQATIERLAARHRDHNLPCDALWLDIEYMNGYRVFTWNEKFFPDVPGMLGRLAEQGYRAITIVDPGVKYEPGYWVFDQALERDVLCKTEGGDIYIGQVWPGKTAFPDFVTEEGRDWWGELNAAHVQSGLAGIWNDMNEPATGAVPPHAMRFGKGRYSHARFHNQYALLMAMGTVDGLLRAMPDKRTFVLSRAGFAGIQRYAANWMGDNLSRWDHLWMSIPMAMGLGLSGQPFVGADIGGFDGSTNAELFTRWIQCGVLTAFCRNHSTVGASDQYVWAFGDVVEELSREALQLRYRLLPYIYATFMQSTETGAPVQQPLVFAFQNDRTLRDIDDQYLFGEHLLVAPVYEPGMTARQVYLPEGTWYHWHTGERFAGKRFVLAPTPMEYIPLYARGGAVIPMWPDAPPSTAGYHPAAIELHIFVPEADGEYQSVLHEDDGLTFAFREGAYYRTSFTLRRAGDRLTLEASVAGNGYP
ncbi:MAG TPA: glycoside hydrolase family 31 protein, partial [Burkholderiaceae bacterium]|nr:glycoside hydrolase family 31 protein [Burkholderiaceae bacterium]